MQVTTGKVFRVHTKAWGEGADAKNLYSVKLDGTDKDEWYRMGEKRHEGIVEEGYTIKIGFEVDGKGNRQVKKVKVLEKGDPIAPAPRRSGGGARPAASATATKAVDWDAKDANIQYQSSRKDALVFLQILVTAEALKLPAKTKVSERLAAIEGYVDLYTSKFFADIAVKGAVTRAEDETNIEATLPQGNADAPTEAPAASSDGFDDDEEEF